MAQYIMALDAGTTSNRCILFDQEQNIIGSAQRELTQIYPKPGWVEQDPMEIWSTQYSVLTEVLAQTGVSPEELAAIGITNQRETTIVWDRATGEPVYNAIVWQCRRTSAYCDELKARGYAEAIRRKTGLVVDAYFSGRPELRLRPEAEKKVRNGVSFPLPGTEDGEYRVYGATGEFLSLSRVERGTLRTIKSFFEV